MSAPSGAAAATNNAAAKEKELLKNKYVCGREFKRPLRMWGTCSPGKRVGARNYGLGLAQWALARLCNFGDDSPATSNWRLRLRTPSFFQAAERKTCSPCATKFAARIVDIAFFTRSGRTEVSAVVVFAAGIELDGRPLEDLGGGHTSLLVLQPAAQHYSLLPA